MIIKQKEEVTAYSLYSIQQKERVKINPLEDIYPHLPDKNIKLSMQIRHGIIAGKCSMTRP